MSFKNLVAIICGAMILSSSLCFAAVDGGKIALGGIMPGMSETDLIKNFQVEVERGRVEKVSTRMDSITTPDGVRVGQAADILNSTFGRADKVDNDSDGVEYEYYSTDGTKKIEFKVVNGVIAKITCKIND